MTYDQVVKHFGGVSKAAIGLKLTSQALWYWKSKGIPYLRQLQIEKVTGGKLKAKEK